MQTQTRQFPETGSPSGGALMSAGTGERKPGGLPVARQTGLIQSRVEFTDGLDGFDPYQSDRVHSWTEILPDITAGEAVA